MYCIPKTMNYLTRLSSFTIGPGRLYIFINAVYKGLTDRNCSICNLKDSQIVDEILLSLLKSLKIQELKLITKDNVYFFSEVLMKEIGFYPAYYIDGTENGGLNLAKDITKYLTNKYPSIRSIVNKLKEHNEKHNSD